MKTNLRKVLSVAMAMTLLVTCAISGIVLPAAAVETNLIVNGDFEQGPSASWGNSAYIMDGVGVGGSKGVKIETTVNEGDTAVWPAADYKAAFNSILEPYTTYVFSFDYKHEGKGFGKFDINRVGSDWTGAWADVNLPDVADWTTYTIEFTTGAAENMNANTGWEWSVRHMHYANATHYGTGAAYFDNFKLEKKPSAATAIALDKASAIVTVGEEVKLTASALPEGAVLPEITWTSSDESVVTVDGGVVKGIAVGAATVTATADGLTPVTCVVTVEEPSLLLNGNFERGASVAWGNSAYIMDGVGVGGSKGFKVETTVNEGETAIWPGADYKGEFNAILKPYTTYIFSFDYKHEGKGFGKIDIAYGGTDWTGAWADVNLPDVTEWTTFTYEFTTGAAENMNIRTGWEWSVRHVHYANAAHYGTGAAYFDNFKLKEKPVPVITGIALDKTSYAVEIGKEFTLSASTIPAGAELPEITWTSSDESIATVDGGVVKGIAVGTATITATAVGLPPVTCTVMVEEPALIVNGTFEQGPTASWGNSAYILDGVGVNGSKGVKIESTVAEGGAAVWPAADYKAAFIAILEPHSTYILTFDYKHEGAGFAQFDISRSGTDWVGWKDVTLPAVTEWTTYTLIFSTGAAENMNANTGWEWSVRQRQSATDIGSGVSYFDNFKLVKQPEAESIQIIPSEITLLPDSTASLQVVGTPANTSVGLITWTSGDENVVSVSQDGVITALATSGTVTITATSAKGLVATCKVTIDEYGNLLKNGDFEQGDANWHPDVPGAIKPGIGKDGGYGLELTIPEGSSTTSTFYKLPLSVMPGTTYEISFDYLATPGSDFRIWSGTTKLISPVPEEGDGTTWKHASRVFTTPADMTLNPGWDLSVSNKTDGTPPAVIDNICLRLYTSGVEAESITINKSTITMVPGRTESLSVMATPVDGDINRTAWTSSDENVAIVEYGVVTAVGKGTATITATTLNGKTSTCVVTVSGEEALVTNPSFDIVGDDSWTLSGGAVIESGKGRVNSSAAVLTSGGSVSQTIKGLQPGKTYTLSFVYRSTSGYATAKLTNGEAVLLEEKTDTLNSWKKASFEITVPEDAAEAESVLTLTTTDAGPIYLDNVVFAQKASLIDFVVEDIVWDGGDDQVAVGTELLFAVTVANKGVDAVPVDSVIEVDIAVDGKVVRTLTYTCTMALETNDIAIVMDTEPWAATEGALVISARANPRLTILETNSGNNANQVHLRVADEKLPVPEIAQKAGMDRLIFSDEFDTIDSIDTLATGDEGYKWYVTRNWSAGTVTRDAYEIENGILTLKDPHSKYGITLTTVDINTQNGFSWNKGYLEVRLRIPNPEVTGGGPTVWSLPLGKMYETPGDNTHWVEMDWLEFWGIAHSYDKGYWTVTMHDSTRPEGESEVTEWYVNGKTGINAMGDKEWHTLGWVWDENIIQAYMDGVKVFEQTYSEDDIPTNPIPTVKKGQLKEGIFSAMNEHEMCLMLGGIVENPMEVDYVRIWKGVGGGMVPGNGDEEEVVDMNAEDFWYNYCTDDWGDPIVEATEENYLNILGGKEIWEKLSDERRAEINALLEEYGMPAYDSLLAAALRIENGDVGDTPDTGVATRVAPLVALLALSGTALWMTRKRKKGQW